MCMHVLLHLLWSTVFDQLCCVCNRDDHYQTWYTTLINSTHPPPLATGVDSYVVMVPHSELEPLANLELSMPWTLRRLGVACVVWPILSELTCAFVLVKCSSCLLWVFCHPAPTPGYLEGVEDELGGVAMPLDTTLITTSSTRPSLPEPLDWFLSCTITTSPAETWDGLIWPPR